MGQPSPRLKQIRGRERGKCRLAYPRLLDWESRDGHGQSSVPMRPVRPGRPAGGGRSLARVNAEAVSSNRGGAASPDLLGAPRSMKMGTIRSPWRHERR